MSVLLTGGTGYIGSHIAVELLNLNKEVVLFDNFSNSSSDVASKIEEITGKSVKLYEGDIRNLDDLRNVFSSEDIEYVIHLAGFKAVGESVSKPLDYYENNVYGTVQLVKVMAEFGVKKIIFSSSATVYGTPVNIPITESDPKGICTNPYGWTKWMVEQVLEDVHTSDPEWSVVLLRYFNPVGAHKSGLIGELPQGIPNNLSPYITQVASGKRPHLNVFGNDYETIDGTGVRDYIHVVDLAIGHVKAAKKLEDNSGVSIYNLGTGRGTSVFELLHSFEKAVGKEIPYVIKGRRPGDIDTSYCDPQKAKNELGWEATHTVEEMCEDSWRFEQNN